MSSVELDENTTSEDLKELLRTVCSVADYDISRQKRMAVDRHESSGELLCKDTSGSTGVFSLISKRYIAIANVGDSRALLAQFGTPPLDIRIGMGMGTGIGTEYSQQSLESPIRSFLSAIDVEDIPKNVLIATALSVDHKFCIQEERERAEAAGAV